MEVREASEKKQGGQLFLAVALVAGQLGVTARTVRRYIKSGIAEPGGNKIKLEARLVATENGQEYQIRPFDLEAFVQQRAQSVRERLTDQQLLAVKISSRAMEQEGLRQHLQKALHLIEQQAERLASQAETIERLAHERGALSAEMVNDLLTSQVWLSNVRNCPEC